MLEAGVALGLALGIAGPALSQGAGAANATIRVFQFQPSAVEVRAGARVTWTNQDDITHTVTSGAPGSPDGRFDVPLAGKGASGSATFAAPGVYPYFCARHQSMRGEVVVR
ncbi:MAG TPA: plastocyanin/azurin family copper-binding protein [Methylomirabilota bacterium]|jgi:plastocyanin|nr:plastocyanin/azurin family copper-binding protein [Methylomirabilota bacterium]